MSARARAAPHMWLRWRGQGREAWHCCGAEFPTGSFPGQAARSGSSSAGAFPPVLVLQPAACGGAPAARRQRWKSAGPRRSAGAELLSGGCGKLPRGAGKPSWRCAGLCGKRACRSLPGFILLWLGSPGPRNPCFC